MSDTLRRRLSVWKEVLFLGGERLMKLAAIGTFVLGGSVLAILVSVAHLPLVWALLIAAIGLLVALAEGVYQLVERVRKAAIADREHAVLQQPSFITAIGDPQFTATGNTMNVYGSQPKRLVDEPLDEQPAKDGS